MGFLRRLIPSNHNKEIREKSLVSFWAVLEQAFDSATYHARGGGNVHLPMPSESTAKLIMAFKNFRHVCARDIADPYEEPCNQFIPTLESRQSWDSPATRDACVGMRQMVADILLTRYGYLQVNRPAVAKSLMRLFRLPKETESYSFEKIMADLIGPDSTFGAIDVTPGRAQLPRESGWQKLTGGTRRLLGGGGDPDEGPEGGHGSGRGGKKR